METIVEACSANSQSREEAVPQATAIVLDEVERFAAESLERECAPYIEALVRMAEGVRQANLAWALAQVGSENQKERKLLEDLSIRMVRGMLQAPIRAMKHELRGPVERAVLVRLFGIEAADSQ
jgi:glutamyl-tRNA reductase